MGQGRETQERGAVKSHVSDSINGEFVYECGKLCEDLVRQKLVPHGALRHRGPFGAL